MSVNLLLQHDLSTTNLEKAIHTIESASGNRNWLGQYEVTIGDESVSEAQFFQIIQNLYQQVCKGSEGSAIQYPALQRGKKLLHTVDLIQAQKIESREDLFILHQLALFVLDSLCSFPQPQHESLRNELHMLFCDLSLDPFSNQVFSAAKEILNLPEESALRAQYLRTYRHITSELQVTKLLNQELPERDPKTQSNSMLPVPLEYMPFLRLENARQTLIALARSPELVEKYPILSRFS